MGPHARAAVVLSREQRMDARCVRCHGTTAASMADTSMGVGCEQCHGAGVQYAKGYIMRDHDLSRILGLIVPREQDCVRCHTFDSPRVEAFDFGKAWLDITHSKLEAAAAPDGIVQSETEYP